MVVNKVDRPDARTEEVVTEAMELICEMGGEEFLDNFHHIYASAKEGFATTSMDDPSDNMNSAAGPGVGACAATGN